MRIICLYKYFTLPLQQLWLYSAEYSRGELLLTMHLHPYATVTLLWFQKHLDLFHVYTGNKEQKLKFEWRNGNSCPTKDFRGIIQ
jgi:hypothetical protein